MKLETIMNACKSAILKATESSIYKDDDRRLLNNWLDNLQWYPGYANATNAGSRPSKGVLAADWNRIDRYDSLTKTRTEIMGGDIPERMCRILEKAGFDIEWSDGGTACDDCGNWVETEPTGYWWTPEYRFDEDGCGYVCDACWDCQFKGKEYTPKGSKPKSDVIRAARYLCAGDLDSFRKINLPRSMRVSEARAYGKAREFAIERFRIFAGDIPSL